MEAVEVIPWKDADEAIVHLVLLHTAKAASTAVNLGLGIRTPPDAMTTSCPYMLVSVYSQEEAEDLAQLIRRRMDRD